MWDWRGYISFAATVRPRTSASNDEMAAARAAISRAYYGAYHTTWEYVFEKQYPITRQRCTNTIHRRNNQAVVR